MTIKPLWGKLYVETFLFWVRFPDRTLDEMKRVSLGTAICSGDSSFQFFISRKELPTEFTELTKF
jgi:hypothetical protein